MNTILILDKDAKTELSEDFKERILRILKEKAHLVEVVELRRNNVTPCFNCLFCHVNQYNMTIFLTPVIFGHFGSMIKCAIYRGCDCNNLQVVIGYGEDIDEEEKSTFIDFTRKYRGKADIVHPHIVTQVDVYLTTSSEDSEATMTSEMAWIYHHKLQQTASTLISTPKMAC